MFRESTWTNYDPLGEYCITPMPLLMTETEYNITSFICLLIEPRTELLAVLPDCGNIKFVATEFDFHYLTITLH